MSKLILIFTITVCIGVLRRCKDSMKLKDAPVVHKKFRAQCQVQLRNIQAVILPPEGEEHTYTTRKSSRQHLMPRKIFM